MASCIAVKQGWLLDLANFKFMKIKALFENSVVFCHPVVVTNVKIKSHFFTYKTLCTWTQKMIKKSGHTAFLRSLR